MPGERERVFSSSPPTMTKGGSYRWMASPTRRRRTRTRAAGVGLGLGIALCLTLMLSSTDAALFKRKRTEAQQQQQHSRPGGKGKGGKRGKVKEDVAWLLEDTSDGAWKPVRDDGHVQVWKRSMPNSDFVAIKSKASLAVSPQALFEVLTPGDIEIVRQYNPLVEDGSDLEVMDRDNKVSWSATMGVWPCRPRDFVTHIRRATLDDGSVAIVNSATTHPKAPAKGKYVRGEILHGVFHIKAAKKNKKHSEFTMVHHFNPGGNIPPWLINWLAEGKPITFVRKLEEVAGKWDRQAALSKSMPCKGRGFADKPCAFLLTAADGGQDADGVASGAPVAGRGWILTTLAMAALACCGWVGCFGWPAVLKEKGAVARPPAAAATTAQVKMRKEENGTAVVTANVVHALPDTHGTPEATPPLERPPSVLLQEVRKEAVVHGEQVVEKAAGEVLNGGKAQDLDRPNGEGPGDEVSVAAENGEDIPVGELIGGESVTGEREELLPSAAAAATAAAIAEMPEEENGSPAGADIAHALPTAQEEPQIPLCDGELTRKELGKGEFPSVEENGGKTTAPEANGSGEVGGSKVTASGGSSKGKVEDGGVATTGEELNGDACNGNVSIGEVRGGKVADLEVGSEQLPAEEVPNGEALAPLDSMSTFGNKPFKK